MRFPLLHMMGHSQSIACKESSRAMRPKRTLSCFTMDERDDVMQPRGVLFQLPAPGVNAPGCGNMRQRIVHADKPRQFALTLLHADAQGEGLEKS